MILNPEYIVQHCPLWTSPFGILASVIRLRPPKFGVGRPGCCQHCCQGHRQQFAAEAVTVGFEGSLAVLSSGRRQDEFGRGRA